MSNLVNTFSNLIDASSTLTDKVSASNIKSNSIAERLAILEDKVESLKFSNAETVTSSENLNQPDKDLVVEIQDVVSGTTVVSAKDLNVIQLTANDGLVKFTATEDVSIKNLTTTGNLEKSVAHAQVSINNPGYVKITQSNINQTGYNAIEIGLKTTPKSVIIDGINFNSALSNNAILVFGTADGGSVTISNCSFTKCSNPLRISNKNGGKVTVNIIDCEFGEWDPDPTWAGMIICQDYTSKSVEAEQANNLFSPDKVTINIVNCTKNGEKITMTSPEAVCGTGNADTQLLYVWNSCEETVPYSVDRYPTLNVK